MELGGRERTGIDLPSETRSSFPSTPATDYYNRRFGARGWSNAVSLNLAIGQGENAQTVVNMARFYTALATDGHAVVVLSRSPAPRPFDHPGISAAHWQPD